MASSASPASPGRPPAGRTGGQTAVGGALASALPPLRWQCGLDVRPVMLLGGIQRVDGVLGVARFAVAVDGTPVDDPAAAVRLARNEVVAPGEHTLFVRYGEDR